MQPEERLEEVRKRSERRADSLLEKINRRIQETLEELRRQGKDNAPGIEAEFEGGRKWTEEDEEDAH